MKEGAPRRFYKAAHAAPAATGGFAVLLDGRGLKTPAKAAFAAPTLALAELCASEWAAQDEFILPETMPLTRLVNVAIDHAPAARADLARTIAKFAETDLVCYRAEGPSGLVARQAAAWNPLLAWAGESLGAPLAPVTGVIAAAQPPASLAALHARAAALDDFPLTGLAHAAGLAGSAVIAFALLEKRQGEAAFAAAALDDLYQLEIWGEDREARARLDGLAAEFAALARFFAALG